jgi:succinoglycan biosynthesis transport protein ExoP
MAVTLGDIRDGDRPGATRVSAPASLRDLLLTLRRRWRLTAAIALLIPAMTAFGIRRITPQYRANGTLLYAPVDFAPKLLQGVIAANPGTDTVMASQAAVIRSLPAIKSLIRTLHLARRADFNPALAPPPAWRRWLGQKPQPAKADPALTIAIVEQALSVTVVPNSRVIEVGFTSTDPRLAARAANLVMQLYLDHQRRENFAALQSAQTWLMRRASETAVALEQSDTAIALARARAGVASGTQGSLAHETASRIAQNVVAAENDLAGARARLAAAQGGNAGSDAAEANAAIAASLMPLRTREAELAAKLSELSASEGPNYPDIAATRQELAAERAQLDAEKGRIIGADRAQVTADESRVATLRAALARAQARSSVEAMSAAPIAGLEQKADAESSLLRALTEQIGTLASQGALTRPDARILSRAMPPLQPSAPRLAMMTLGAALLGLSLGCLAAILAEASESTFRSGGDIRTALDLSCIALLPELPARTRQGMTIAEYAKAHPFSLFAEQLRALRAGIWMDGARPRILAVTAARPGEGKTTLTLGLAASAAAAGLGVIVIDCDIRQPSFDAEFGLGGALGLTDYLAGRAALAQIIHRQPELGLDVIPAGSIATDALSLFTSARMGLLMDALRASHGLVLLDLPPTFALAETKILARAADATLFCVRWGDTPKQTASASLALLHEAEVRLIGAVLTRVDAAKHRVSGFPDAEIYHPRYGGYFQA